MVKKRVDKLSSQQIKFCTELASGKSQREAYSLAYPSIKRSDLVTDTNASRLLSNAKVFNYYQSLLKKSAEKAKITRETQLADLQTAKKIALETKQLKPFISAIAEQNKLLGLYEADRLDLSNTDGSLKTPVVNFIIDGTVKDVK